MAQGTRFKAQDDESKTFNTLCLVPCTLSLSLLTYRYTDIINLLSNGGRIHAPLP
jgi:hypothetical protein